MIKHSIFVKNKLSSIIKRMEKSIDSFVVNTKKDFTRNRKLKFEDMIKLLLSMGGYESYNNFAHIEGKGWKYVIRVRDKNSTGMVSSFNLPSEEEFDKKISLSLTRRQTK